MLKKRIKSLKIYIMNWVGKLKILSKEMTGKILKI